MSWFKRNKKDSRTTRPTDAQGDPESVSASAVGGEPAESVPSPVEDESSDDANPPAWHPELDAYWSQLGTVDPHVISYLINPMFLGAPPWPGVRQAYRIVRTPDTVIIASDGLSDVSPKQPGAGFGCEVYIESAELVGAQFEDLRSSWMFKAIENFAQNVAAMQGISDHLREYGVASMELPADGTDVPARLVTENDTVGALIGMPAAGRAAQVTTADGPIDIVPLTIIGTDELEVVVGQEQAGRDQVVAGRQQDGRGHLTVT